MTDAQVIGRRLTENIERVILGKTREVRLVLVALLCEGHILVEDVPGVGKTMMSRAVARSLGCSFARVQCTPDLLPSDLIGVTIYNQKTQDFEFRPGPLHHQILLADEINRATPKTQSALLEAMEERQVTVEGRLRPLPRPFLVLATQNPIEYEGTFPLPEAQLDRFLLRLKLGYPSFEAENDMILKQKTAHPIEDLPQVVTAEELTSLQARARQVHVDDSLREYIVRLVQRTREQERLFLGASPRGSLALYRAAQAMAVLEGRDFVLADDVQELVLPTLGHRMLGRDGAGGRQVDEVLRSLLEQVKVPV
ncbi:MoxR family ATPase [bacterium CPR1]|nr:MoxR family ATPase [bacterium CPR1]